MPVTGLIVATVLMVYAGAWAVLARGNGGVNAALRLIERAATLPAYVWMALGAAAFVLPVLEYWLTARSHSNALAGFLPWADAIEYFQCSEVYLLGIDGPVHCAKRPYYNALYADLLWLSGNRHQVALLVQALLLGAIAVTFAKGMLPVAGRAGAVAAYAVFYVYAAALCAGLVMTENAGVILGALGILVLLHSARSAHVPAFLVGMVILAAAMTARPGPLFVLPALGAWFLFFGEMSLARRFLVASAAGTASLAGMAVVLSPIFIVGGETGSAHSNFSYVLYGLVVGGKGWTQVAIDHPEIFDPGAISQTDRVYALALEKFRERPDMALFGYIKGVAKYFDALFRYATDFKPLRLALLLIPWCLGVFYALRRWRDPRCAMLLAIQAGIIVSSPFLIYDGHNRAFASTVAVDAAFVALGMLSLGSWGEIRKAAAVVPAPTVPAAYQLAALAALVLPVAMLAAIRPHERAALPSAPSCEAGQIAAVLAPGTSTLVLPLVDVRDASIFPLQVAAGSFASRLGRGIQAKDEMRLEAGNALVWGIRLERGARAALSTFVWRNGAGTAAQRMAFCVARPARGKWLGVATSQDVEIDAPNSGAAAN